MNSIMKITILLVSISCQAGVAMSFPIPTIKFVASVPSSASDPASPGQPERRTLAEAAKVLAESCSQNDDSAPDDKTSYRSLVEGIQASLKRRFDMDTMISNLKMFEDIEAGIDNDRMALAQELAAFTSTTTSKLVELHEERLAVATAIQQINKKLDDMERDGTSFEAEDALRSRIAADATAEEARKRDAAAKQLRKERRSQAIAA
jgi:hypothetical protein